MTGEKIAEQKANNRQVGGDHYDTGDNAPQHWDLFGLDYLIGYATKYVRWRKKGGVQDLEKMIHVVEKIREKATDQNLPKYNMAAVLQWQQAIGLDFVERQIVNRIMFMRGRGDLEVAIEGIRYLIERAQQSALVNIVPDDKKSSENQKPTRSVPRQVDARESARPDADESRHASVYPWQMSRDQWGALSPERRALMLPFYAERGVVWLLDAAVVTNNLPRELAPCYTMIRVNAVNTWILRVDRVPYELRDMYPRLMLEQNGVEHDQLPDWQRQMYEWCGDEETGRWILRSEHAAWGWKSENG